MSPERLQGKKASKESDMWALSLVFLEIVSGHPVNSFLDVPGTVNFDKLANLCPRHFYDVFAPCFHRDLPQRRRTADELRLALRSTVFDVFISYRVATDAALAKDLYKILTAPPFNLAVFLDSSATGIPVGVHWAPYFLQALSCSTIVVPLVSVPGVVRKYMHARVRIFSSF